MDSRMRFTRLPKKNETITILWQPKFHYCNYDCFYCPVQQARENQKHFDWDKERFSAVLEKILALPFRVNLIIGPGGEPFISPLITRSISRITKASNIQSVLVLSNVGVKQDLFEAFLAESDVSKLSIAAAYHPTQAKNLDEYIQKLAYLKNKGVSLISILVAVPDDQTFVLISKMKEKLRPMGIPFFPTGLQGEYNGKSYPANYDEGQKAFLKNVMFTPIDYEYKILCKKPGLCDAGRTYFHLDHDGSISNCMMMKVPMGNIFSGLPLLADSPILCTARVCHCQMEYWNTLDFKTRYVQSNSNIHVYQEKKWNRLLKKVQAYQNFVFGRS